MSVTNPSAIPDSGANAREVPIITEAGAPPKLSDRISPPPSRGGATLGELFSKLSDLVSALVSDEIALAKAKGAAMARRAGAGGALLGVAGVLALYMLGTLLYAAVLGFSLVVPAWAAALIVAGILLLVIFVLALIGLASLKKAKKDKPDPQSGLKMSIAAAKKGLEK